MPQLDQPFNSDDYPQEDDRFEPLPSGWYAVEIEGSDLEHWSSGTGCSLSFKERVVGVLQGDAIVEKYKGRVLFARHTYRAQSDQAMAIGRRELGELGRSSGVPQFAATEQLHGRRLLARVGVEKGGVNQRTGEQYADKNKVIGYKPLPGSQMPRTKAPHRPHPGATQNQQQPRHPQAPAPGFQQGPPPGHPANQGPPQGQFPPSQYSTPQPGAQHAGQPTGF